MKKLTAIILIMALLVSFAACGEKQKDNPPVTPPPVEEPQPKPSLKLSLEEWPVIDGALAMIPYYEEMAARLLDMPIEDARKHVLANNTPMAYQNLAEGNVDMVFCAPPSEEQIEYAKSKGVEFESVQVLNSGFVFFVNKDNPVDSLTSKQLYDIYAGKITNWKEVGGNDEEIIAYQRAEGSGSQTGLYEHVIPKDEVAEPVLEKRIAEMGAIIDAVAHFENSKGAIGFSYYYYVTNMHYQEDVKLIAIDKVYPTPETIAANMYPFISKTCACFNKNQPEDSVVRQIANWCASEEGMKMAQYLGYVPNDNEGYVIPGYGDTFKFQTPPEYITENNIEIVDIKEDITSDKYDYEYCNHQYFQISGLKDSSVEKAINGYIFEIYDKYVNGGYIPPYRMPKQGDIKVNSKDDISFFYNITGNNSNILSGYFSVYGEFAIDGQGYYFDAVEPFNFDLRTGKQLALSDVLIDPDNMINYLNSLLYKEITDGDYDEEGFYDVYESWKLAAPFKGLGPNQRFYINNDGWLTLVFDWNTPEFYTNLHYATHYINDAEKFLNYDACKSSECLFLDENPVYRFLTSSYESEDIFVQTWEREDIKKIIGDRPIDIWGETTYNPEMSEIQKYYAKGDSDLVLNNAMGIVDDYDMISSEFQEVYGSVSMNSYYTRVGKYLDIHQNYYRWLNYMKNGMSESYEDYGLSQSYCFGEDPDLLLGLDDVFVPGTDIQQILRDSFKRFFEYENQTTYEAEYFYPYVDAAIDGMTGFAIDTDALTFSYFGGDMYNVPGDTLQSFYRLPYKYIGCENLVIFN